MWRNVQGFRLRMIFVDRRAVPNLCNGSYSRQPPGKQPLSLSPSLPPKMNTICWPLGTLTSVVFGIEVLASRLKNMDLFLLPRSSLSSPLMLVRKVAGQGMP